MRDSGAIDRILLVCVLALAVVGVVTLFGDQLRALFEQGQAAVTLAP